VDPRVFVRMTGPTDALDGALDALDSAGIGPIAIVLGDDQSPSWVEIEQPGTSSDLEVVCGRIEHVLAAAEVAGFQIREYGAKPITLPGSSEG